MTELFINQRAQFLPHVQRAFLEKVKTVLSVREMAKICNCSERTIRDWRREKFSISIDSMRKLSEAAGVLMPTNFTTRDVYAHTSEAGKKGGRALIAKFGKVPVEEGFRKARWQVWWDTTGKFLENEILQSKPISTPEINTELAEFIGIMLGDGGVSDTQISVTLHHTDDLAYSTYVAKLIETLFSVSPSVYHIPKKSINSLVVSRVELVRYLHTLGLPAGNKIRHQIDIPSWIKECPDLATACIRGLIDTDGCVFTHSYTSKGKVYSYKKIDFTSASEPLRTSVYLILESLGMHPRLTRGSSVRLENKGDVQEYFANVGSHNPKHLNRYAS